MFRVAGQAKYMIMVPRVDNLGNPLTDIAAAAHRFLFYGPLKVEGSYIDPGKRGNWRDDDPEEYDHLITFAEDTPQMDSEMKQLAAEIADAANQWGIFMTKEGGGNIVSWTVPNPVYREGEPALDVARTNDPLF
jgi:hypothetical protein